MNPEQKEFMSLLMPPARLSQEQTAWYLGFQAHDIPTLVAAGLLKPLGKPVPNGLKYFASVELQRLRDDAKWLARASDAIADHWRRKNRTSTGSLGRTLKRSNRRTCGTAIDAEAADASAVSASA